MNNRNKDNQWKDKASNCTSQSVTAATAGSDSAIYKPLTEWRVLTRHSIKK
jgi:hypothetical protein